MPALTDLPTYQELVDKIQSEIEGLKFLVQKETVQTYWEIGKFISEYLLEDNNRAGYGEHLYERLEQDVGIHERNLSWSVKFYKYYPILNARSKLSWTHYRALIGIDDDIERKKIEQLTIENAWTSKELAEYIQSLRVKEIPQEPIKDITQLNAERGKLYTYKIVAADFLHQRKRSMVIDCGFDTMRIYSLKGIARPKPGMIIESKKKGAEYSFQRSQAKEGDLYTFVAFVEKVIDGDTLVAHIDCGFDVWSHQSLRFKGIDTPELSTKKGKEAKVFVENIMKKVPFIVVKIYEKEKYGRFLADIYYSFDEDDPEKVAESGTFLNQELLDLKFAKNIS